MSLFNKSFPGSSGLLEFPPLCFHNIESVKLWEAVPVAWDSRYSRGNQTNSKLCSELQGSWTHLFNCITNRRWRSGLNPGVSGSEFHAFSTASECLLPGYFFLIGSRSQQEWCWPFQQGQGAWGWVGASFWCRKDLKLRASLSLMLDFTLFIWPLSFCFQFETLLLACLVEGCVWGSVNFPFT